MNEKCGSKIVTEHTSYICMSSVILIFPWSIRNGCCMPAGNAYPSGHLVPSPIVGLACAPIVETRFLELAMFLLDFSPRIPPGTFSILLSTIQFSAVSCACNQTKTDKVPRDVRSAKFGKITTRLSNRLVSRSRTYGSTNRNEPGIRQTNFMQEADLKLNMAQLV